MDILKVFNELYQQYEPQGWWPTSRSWKLEVEGRELKIVGQRQKEGSLGGACPERAERVEWARDDSIWRPQYYPGKYGRKLSESEKFEIAIGAILTQNTAWKNVEKAIICLHQNGLMSPQAILDAPIGTLRKCIRSSGYYKQKTKKVRIFCKWLVGEYGGELGRFFAHATPSHSSLVRGRTKTLPLLNKEGLGEVAALQKELLSLWGIGPETADSILLYAGGLPTFVVDAYTKRLCDQHGVRFKTYDEYQQFFEQGLAGEILRQPFDSAQGDIARDGRGRRTSRRAQDDRIKRSHRPLTPTLSLKRGKGKLVVLYQEYHALIVKWGKSNSTNLHIYH